MDSSNHWYGHAHILAEYCGLDPARPPRISGVVQHGWNVLHGFGPGHNPPDGFLKYIWSDVSRRRGMAVGWRDYAVIGSPWAYLLQLEPDRSEHREGTIFYPFHTWEQGTIEGSHEDLIAEIKATEPGPVTICLYWIEYDMPEVRGAYEDAGFRVICHGQRGTYWQGTNRRFLHGQLAELRKHERVASNRLSTAILYGASVGCGAGVYGPQMDFLEDRGGFDPKYFVQRLHPGLHDAAIDRELATGVARTELGLDNVLPADELRYLLGWSAA
jgi:hypothetical protein